MAEALPFHEKKQSAVLGYLLLNEKFFLQARLRIKPEWFNDPYAGKIFKIKLAWYEKYKRIASIEEIKNCNEVALEDAATQNKIHAKINIAQLETANFGLDALGAELEDWLKARLYQEAVTESTKLFNNSKFQESYSLLKSKIQDINEIKFVGDHEEVFDNYILDFEKLSEERKDALTSGISIFDKQLLQPGPGEVLNGCFLPGDTTIFLAASNVGKTSCLLTVAVHNIKRCKDVLVLTHEGRPADIKNKIWCSFLNINQGQLLNLVKDPTGQKMMNKALAYFQRFLTYVPYNKAGATVEEVEVIIRRRQEELLAKRGKYYDMVVCDYPALLSTNLAKGGLFQRRHIDEITYKYFVQLGLEYKSHMLLAIQSNREGSKVNKGLKEQGRLLVMEDTLESWGPMTAATNVISINRDDWAKQHNFVIFYICKSRSSETGIAVVCKSNYANCITHSDDMGGFAYLGAGSLKDTIRNQVDAVLEQYKGGLLPPHLT